jgi:hypothetical protein
MSVVVSGPRRVYLLVVFSERIGAGVGRHPPLAALERTMRLGPAAGGGGLAGTASPPLVAMRLQRVLGRRLLGLSFLVLDTRARE